MYASVGLGYRIPRHPPQLSPASSKPAPRTRCAYGPSPHKNVGLNCRHNGTSKDSVPAGNLPDPPPNHPQSASAELVSEEGPVRRWRLDYRARWKFWKVGGVCDNRLWMTTDRERGTVGRGGCASP